MDVLGEVLPHGEVLLRHLRHDGYGVGLHHGLHLFAQDLLLLHEVPNAFFDVFAHQALQAAAVEANQLLEDLIGEERGAVLGFLLADDLNQDGASDVVA